MICRLILSILICYLPFTVLGQWKEAGRLPVGHVRSLFETESRLYAASEESFFRSTNADSWTRIQLPKPFTINFIYEYDSKLLIGTDRHGIYEFNPNEQDQNRAWENITDKVFKREKLEGENLSVNAIAASGKIILANVYHEGNPSHGGSHSRIYLSPDGGDNWKQAGQFDTHNFVFSFTIDNTKNRIIASTLDGILTAVVDTTLTWTQRSPLVAKKIISLGGTEFIGLPNHTGAGVLYRSTDNGTTWSEIPISDQRVKTSITDIDWGGDDSKFYLYASTYDGIYKITRDDLIASRAWETEYRETAFISNIRARFSNKFATAETGVLRRLFPGKQWAKAEDGLKINYVYATHANSSFVLAVTDNGLFRSPVNLQNNQFNWEPVARNILVVDEKNRFLETRRAAIASKGTGPQEEIFVATNNGIIRSLNGGISWVKSNSLPVIENPLDKTDSINYQENIQALTIAGNDLYAVAYETPFILKNREGTWREITKGLPFVLGRTGGIFYNGIIKGIKEISGEVYLYWEDYTSSAGRGGHDIWTFPDLKGSGIYKLDMASEAWVAIKSLPVEAKIHGFAVYGDSLIFSAQNKNNTYTFHSLNVKDLTLQTLDNPLSDTDGFVKAIYKSDKNLFITNTDNEIIFVSADGGRVWKTIDDAPSTVSSLTVSNELVYTGITGNGMWYKSFNEFFPTFIEKQDSITVVETGDNNKITESNTGKISITLNRYIPGTKVTLYTRSLTRDNWQPWPVTSESETPEKFSITLPHQLFDEVGLAYYWAVEPPKKYQNPESPVIKSNIIRVAVQYTNPLLVPDKIKPNKNPKKAKYQMLSFPLLSNINTVEAMLGDELKITENDPGLWRLTYYNGINPDGSPNWPDTDKDDLLTIGQGYWLAATTKGSKSDQITVSPGKTVANALKTDSAGNFYYELPLKANDWTQIGNPFLIHLEWKDVQAYPLNKALNLGDLFTYSNNTRANGGKLAAFSGGYIKNNTSETILRIPVKRNINHNGERKSVESELMEEAILVVDFSIQSEEMICNLPGLGIHAAAQTGLDKFDLVAPPSPGGFPTMHFTTGVAEKQDITRSIVPPLEEGQVWEFTISGIEGEDKATLNWQELKIEEGKALWLHDLQGERKLDMRLVNSYQFIGLRRFRVYYGTEQYLKKYVMPEKSVLAVYPNPFTDQATINFTLPKNTGNSEVKLTLLDVKGNRIQLIHESTFEAGFHELEWNTMQFANKIPNGLYIVEIQIRSQTDTKTHYQKVIKK